MSFKKQFLLILMGVVCLNFLFVFISFNVLIKSHIAREAKTELKQSVERWETLEMEAVSFDITITEAIAHAVEIPAADMSDEMQTQFLEAAFVVNAQPTTSIIDTKYIVLNHDDQVVYPTLKLATNETENQIKTIKSYVDTNKNDIQQSGHVTVTTSDNSLYIATVPIQDEYNVVLYTDVSPIQSFTTQVNISLFVLLCLSGIVVVLFGVRMSGGLNQTIGSLCQFANNIGKGDFTQKPDINWRYLEFDQLAASMESMSDQLAQSDAKQKKFFQNVSHELRTPLMSIQGYAEGILEDVFENPKEAAEIVLTESSKMAHMVNEILYISKIDQTNGLKKELINVNKIIQTCIKNVDMISKKQEIELICQLPEEPIYLLVDAEKITTGITNILSNCIRHGKNSVQIIVKKYKDEIEILIKDDGAGIDVKDIDHIFERFYHGPKGNVGIGLSITKEIIEMHSGTITVKNEQGATFIITLPVVEQ